MIKGHSTLRTQDDARLRPDGRVRGFSLVELIAVMAIMVVMLSLLAPAVGNMVGTAGRKAAVTTLMNTFEQARVAALESGASVHVILRRRAFPENDALMVTRERLQWDTVGTPGQPIQLTKWIELPEKTLFFSQSPLIRNGDEPPPYLKSTGFVPPNPITGDRDSYITFSPRGTISYPGTQTRETLTLFVTEGARDGDGKEARISPQGIAPLERIAFARYTGRARLDVTSLGDTGSEVQEAR